MGFCVSVGYVHYRTTSPSYKHFKNCSFGYTMFRATDQKPQKLLTGDMLPYHITWKSMWCWVVPTLKMLAVSKWPWKSLKVIGIFTIRWVIKICHFQLVVFSSNVSSYAVSELLPHLQRTWLSATLRSPSFLIRQLKVQATCAFRFECIRYIYVRSKADVMASLV